MMRRLSLTSWSLHRSLESGALRLLDLPQRMRAEGIGTLEICHFHLPEGQPGYLNELRAAADSAGVELFSILIDTGDLTASDEAQRAADMRRIETWLDAAAALRTRAVRVVAGEAQPNDTAAIERAIAGLRHMAAYARERGVRVLTENFRSLASTAANCNRILDALDGAVGLCADIGNFPAERRVAEFKAVVARAESIHVKGSYAPDGTLIADELVECLEASRAAGFDGPYTLVYDRPGDSWAGLRRLSEVVAPYTNGAP